MIETIDESIKALLKREMPVRDGEVDIQFDQPKREWSARVSRPTINIFLYDIRENQKLRQTQPSWETERHPDGTATQFRKPVRVDLHYMITTWAAEPEDEHRLLSRILMAFFRFPNVPEELLPEPVRSQNKPVPIMVAQYSELNNSTDLWNVLDNEMRPAISLIVTISVDPYQPLTVPLVRTRDLRIGPSSVPERFLPAADPDRFWTVGGQLHGKAPLDIENTRVRLLEHGQKVHLQSDGRFYIGGLQAGNYTLEVATGNLPTRQFGLSVPSADYDLEI